MIESAGPYEPPKKVSLEDSILDIDRFRNLDLPIKKEYLSPWIKESSVNLISGWRGTGKTWFALSILDAVTQGLKFGPWGCKRSVPCLFLDGEMPPQDIIERVNDLGFKSDRKNPFYIYSDGYANKLGLPRAHLASESWRTKMKSLLVARKIKLWVIDNLASLASGLDENTKKDWDPINSWLLELRFAGISTIMLHHVNKDGGQRGTSAREDNLDISVTLKYPHDYTPEDGARFIVHFIKARVRTKDLHLISDTEFKLIQTESEKYEWVFGNLKQERKKEILKMLDGGFDYNAIAEALGISKGYITKIKKQAIKDGYLTTKCKLTPSGFEHLYD
jgi:putative DNA primase/helicase